VASDSGEHSLSLDSNSNSEVKDCAPHVAAVNDDSDQGDDNVQGVI
jgi:hypothetical protein